MQSTQLAGVVRRLLPGLVVASVMLTSLPVLGADPATERLAQTLQKRAIEEDNLNVNYPAAIKKLATAISKCTGDKCSATLKGALYRDLGAMLVLSGSVDDGRAAFAKALGFDSSLELDIAYKNPMLEGLWTEARRKVGAANEPEAAPPPDSGGTAPPATGDFAHVPAPAQLVRTPIPVYAEYVGTERLLRVVVKYRGAGMSDWKPVELRKIETGYGGLIPCKDVAEGTVQYYIQGYGTSDDPIASSGTRTKPYVVPIKTQLTGAGPSLPGQEAPRQCAEEVGGSDCPPDFPGCHIQKKSGGEECKRNNECESGECAEGKCVEKKVEGDACDKDSECASGSCSDDKCAAAKKGADEACDTDDECSSGICKDDKCKGEGGTKKSNGPKIRRVWIGVAVGADIMWMPQSDKACLLNDSGRGPATGNPGYECVDPTTSANFPGTGPAAGATNGQLTPPAGNPGSVGGGLLPGNIRIMASLDYAMNANILIGARAGYVLFTDPASSPGPVFPPIHLEGRFTYLVGNDAITNAVAPLLLFAVGASEFDANIGVQVRLSTGKILSENAWLTAGPFFGAAGAGARFAFGKSKGVALTTIIKAQAAFGGSGGPLIGFAPEVGAQIGF